MSAITPSDEMAKANAEYKRLHSDCPPKENKEECGHCSPNKYNGSPIPDSNCSRSKKS